MAKDDLSKMHWLDAWHVNPSANREYDFIDGLRGIAILMVLACHHIYINPQSGLLTHLIGNIFSACGQGVVLFFAISGFLISWPFWKRKFAGIGPATPAGYGWRRFWKIYPPLALSIAVFTPIYIWLGHGDWSYLFMAAKWFLGIPFILPVSGKLNPVMWTLVVEVQFYILLPLIFLAFRRASARAVLWLIPLIFMVVPLGFRIFTGVSATFYPDINSHFPSALDSFALGILIAGLENMKVIKPSWGRLGIAGIFLWGVSILLTAWWQTNPETETFTLGQIRDWIERIASACLLLYVGAPRNVVARLLCTPWLRWCGIVSYEWYLFHQPIALWARIYFGSAEGNLIKYLIKILAPLIVSGIIAAAVYWWFSLPILKYGRSSAKK